ncbi:hypothetical protein WHR41_03905 [Cladosporium halotolerans]|uniref:Histone H4 n=1 Tax=Cladosporium halotolerans TaxID=1052096 RepID=A0AB34KR97_9PEZI
MVRPTSGKNVAAGKRLASSQASRGIASKGLGIGKGGAKRHRKVLRDNIQGITKPDIRRLARRGGVKRISSSIYAEIRLNLRRFLESVMGDVCAIVDMKKRKTITTVDVVYALHRKGKTLYGFGTPGDRR